MKVSRKVGRLDQWSNDQVMFGAGCVTPHLLSCWDSQSLVHMLVASRPFFSFRSLADSEATGSQEQDCAQNSGEISVSLGTVLLSIYHVYMYYIYITFFLIMHYCITRLVQSSIFWYLLKPHDNWEKRCIHGCSEWWNALDINDPSFTCVVFLNAEIQLKISGFGDQSAAVLPLDSFNCFVSKPGSVFVPALDLVH